MIARAGGNDIHPEHFMDTTELLKTGAAELGVKLSPGQLDAFGVYLSELVKWNAKFNLTAIKDPKEIVVKHFMDSLSLVRCLPDGRFSAADIGAGAGFPGLAVKIALPRMRLTLVEPARKKASFLRHMTRLLGIDGAEVAAERVEGFAGARSGEFDVVFSRAFRDPVELLGLVSPLLAGGGRVVLSLGPEMDAEAPEGWRCGITQEFKLPHSDYLRRLAVFEMR